MASDDKPRILGCTERHPVARAITTRPKALVTPRIHGVCGAGGTRTHDPEIMSTPAPQPYATPHTPAICGPPRVLSTPNTPL